MEARDEDDDVYGLVGQLCEGLYRRCCDRDDEHPYLPPAEDERRLRALKARAYEILLNKADRESSGDHEKPCDPIVELIKHVYTLKVGHGRLSQAAELERYLDEFIDEGLEPDSTVYASLQFLNCLKSVDFDDDSSLDVFHYDKPHPLLPEMLCSEGSTPPFQIYPSESFLLPKKFETMFKQNLGGVIEYNVGKPGSNLALLGQFNSTNACNPECIRNNNEDKLVLSGLLRRAPNLSIGTDLTSSSYFIPQIKDIERSEDHFQMCKDSIIVTEPETPIQYQDPLQLFLEKNVFPRSSETEISEIEDNGKPTIRESLDKIWESMDKFSPLSDHRTWETLGYSNPSKEPPFVSESVNATLHLMNVAQSDFSPRQDEEDQSITEVSCKDFISNIKLLLLGVESNTFIYDSVTGFNLKRNTAIHGISTGTLENLSFEITHWGTCFKNLSGLIVPDPQTGKLQVEGLIFKALCSSIKEFLLFYHAAILRVSVVEDENEGLLHFLKKVRPLGNLIVKVAQLCRCDNHRLTSLGQGIGILTHIYKEVTKVTEQNVALVFYSILKDCCEVYFRFLQHWIFEGVCADIYEEFMIEVRPQYLRTRGHRFWTRAFNINKKSVPGFLADLTDSILQCGKAVTLLKVCDPQNPLCRVSASSQPPVRVCLSVRMLREQAKFYEEYRAKGELEQGEVVSLCSAIQEQKEAEKRRAALVIAAQHDTLSRLKKERQDALRKIAKGKSDLLEQLRDQVEKAALRKEKDRHDELLADKMFLEIALKHEEEAKNLEKAERENTIKYYNELAEDARKRRIHADWRIRRMKLFDERVMALSSVRREYADSPTELYIPFDFAEKVEETTEEVLTANEPSTEPDERIAVVTKLEEGESKDENLSEKASPENVENSKQNVEDTVEKREESQKSPEKVESSDNVRPAEDENSNPVASEEETQKVTRAVRPTVLDITSANSEAQRNKHKVLRHEYLLDSGLGDDEPKPNLNLMNLRDEDNLAEARRNKLKVLQHEYLVDGLDGAEKASAQKEADNFSGTLTEAQLNKLKVLHQQFILGDLEETTDPKSTLDLLRLGETDNMTEAQRNKLRLLRQEYGITPNNNESHTILDLTEIQANRLRNTHHLTHLNWQEAEGTREDAVVSNESRTILDLTEIQANRLRNTRHLTHLNWQEAEDTGEDAVVNNESRTIPDLTEIQTNRLRNTRHLTHLNWQEVEDTREDAVEKTQPLTEAQVNRNKVMSHFYNKPEETEFVRNKSEVTSELQRNRNRNMGHNRDHLDLELNRFADHMEHFRETPMSTATDLFTGSTHSGSLHVPSCENTPFSEITNHSEIFGRSSDGLSTDGTRQSRNCRYFQDTPSFPQFIGLGSAFASPVNENFQLTVADVEMIDTTSLQFYLENSVIIPLTIQSRLVNRAIIKYLLNEHKMLTHLHNLRSYFFLLNGEFAKTLTQSLFTRLYEASAPVELFHSSTLTGFLEKALIGSLGGAHAKNLRQMLSFSATDVPAYLQTSNPEILSCLSLTYKISWPLNIIFNDIVMQQYSRVFKFLLMVSRVLWVLQEDFHILKVARKTSISKNHHKLQLYRHSMMQFMNALHTYLTCSVLHASWSEFERELECATTLDEVYDTHVSYIKKILSRCMLNVRGEKMRTCLCNIFKVVLKFHNHIRAQKWRGGGSQSSGPNYENLERMYVAFCEQRAYLAHVAEKLAVAGYQPHLMQFLHSLNINPRYDLTSKK